jgi:hypothetical protein
LLTNNKHWLTTNNYDLISFYEAEAVEQFSWVVLTQCLLLLRHDVLRTWLELVDSLLEWLTQALWLSAGSWRSLQLISKLQLACPWDMAVGVLQSKCTKREQYGSHNIFYD